MTEIAFRPDRIDYLLEGNVLGLVGVQGDVTRPFEKPDKGRFRTVLEVETQDQGIDEKTDQRLDLLTGPIRDGRAQHDDALAAVAGEQRGEHGVEHHEQRGVRTSGQLFERPRVFRIDLQCADAAAVGLHRGAGPVRGQLQQARRTRQLSFPVFDLAAEHLAREPILLPSRVVRVLDGQHRELGFARVRREIVGKKRIERDELADQHADGPPIGNDMVHGDQQDVFRHIQTHKAHAEQGTRGKVETASRLLGSQAARFRQTLLLGQVRNIGQQRRYRPMGLDHLDRLLFDRGEPGAKGFVTRDDLRDAPFQGGHV